MSRQGSRSNSFYRSPETSAAGSYQEATPFQDKVSARRTLMLWARLTVFLYYTANVGRPLGPDCVNSCATTGWRRQVHAHREVRALSFAQGSPHCPDLARACARSCMACILDSLQLCGSRVARLTPEGGCGHCPRVPQVLVHQAPDLCTPPWPTGCCGRPARERRVRVARAPRWLWLLPLER